MAIFYLSISVRCHVELFCNMEDIPKIYKAKGLNKALLKGVASRSKLDEIEALCNSSDSDLDTPVKRPRLSAIASPNVSMISTGYTKKAGEEVQVAEPDLGNQDGASSDKVQIVVRPQIFDFSPNAEIPTMINYSKLIARLVNRLPKKMQSTFTNTSALASSLKSRLVSIFINSGGPSINECSAALQVLVCTALLCNNDELAKGSLEEVIRVTDVNNKWCNNAIGNMRTGLEREEEKCTAT